MKEFSVTIKPGYDFLYVCDRNLDVATRELMKTMMKAYLQRMRQKGTSQPVFKGQTVIPVSGSSSWVAVEIVDMQGIHARVVNGAGEILPPMPLVDLYTQEDAGAAFSAVESLFLKI